MKRQVLVVGLLALGFAGAAVAEETKISECRLNYSAGPKVTAVIKQWKFNFANYDKVCAGLRDLGLEMNIDGDSGVLKGRAFAWAIVSLRNSKTGQIGSFTRSSTSLSEDANTPEAERLLSKAIDDSIETFNWAEGLPQIRSMASLGK